MKPQFCSPNTSSSSNTCFTSPQLRLFAIHYNKTHSDKIRINSKNILQDLNRKLTPFVGNNNQHLWPTYLYSKSPDHNLIDIATNSLMPAKPSSWIQNPNTWLTNFDIDAVLFKYSKTKKYHYHFLGTKPIDFAVIHNQSCSFDKDCRIDVSSILHNNKKFIGLVLNLDRHDQSGSHWVSLFCSIDPSLPSYGIYFYDSVSAKIPPIVLPFIHDIQKQLKSLSYPKPKFYTNSIQHQYGNTECGMFSICFQLRWLNLLQKNKNTVFSQIIDVDIDDNTMTKIRDILFRPSYK